MIAFHMALKQCCFRCTTRACWYLRSTTSLDQACFVSDCRAAALVFTHSCELGAQRNHLCVLPKQTHGRQTS